MQVVQLPLSRVMDLRVRVLRQGTPATEAHYAEDNYEDAVHLGIVENNEVVATSTWFAKPCPEQSDTPAYQLKGMAVDHNLQSRGYGAALIRAGISLAQDNGAQLVWARARDSALSFYEKCGFQTVGDGFIDEPTAMPHHIVVKNI